MRVPTPPWYLVILPPALCANFFLQDIDEIVPKIVPKIAFSANLPALGTQIFFGTALCAGPNIDHFGHVPVSVCGVINRGVGPT